MGHTFTNDLFHIILSPAGRERRLRAECRERLCSYLGRIVRNCHGAVLAVKCMQDHVRLLIRLRPDIAVPDLLRDMKANSSGWLQDKFAGFGGLAWQVLKRHDIVFDAEHYLD